ncbi:NAD kinase [Fulvivirgaceae bacterium BMA10]|uniref:NAD kinase n=1 Tax=Splendidivirga corallicola TaxID=3051826 RepID=A0ABT8KNE7_9BACT|nr:NAD kinase [Fulvivirgaceae bacterium BMA10]
MKIAVHGRKFNDQSIPYIQELFKELNNKNTELLVSQYFSSKVIDSPVEIGSYDVYKLGDDLSSVDFVISLGGDGTLLEAVTHVGPLEIPIMGINLGRLGFLATTAKDKIGNAIEALFNDYYTLDIRSLIKLVADQDVFDDYSYGLNEMTILKKDTSSMIVVHTYIDGEYLNSYWSDGLIVSTPTGSTGYSLSCGGPLVLPQSNNFIITPVSPHNLNVRPMIVSDKSVISFEIEGRGKNFLVSLDSRSYTVDASIQMAVRKEDFCAKLVKLNGYNFLDTLRQKLNWGLDVRN